MHARSQRIMLPSPLTLLALSLLSDKMAPTLPFNLATLRQIQDPPGQAGDLPFALAFLVDRIVVFIVVLALSRLAISSTGARGGRRLGELADGGDEDRRGTDVVRELFVSGF